MAEAGSRTPAHRPRPAGGAARVAVPCLLALPSRPRPLLIACGRGYRHGTRRRDARDFIFSHIIFRWRADAFTQDTPPPPVRAVAPHTLRIGGTLRRRRIAASAPLICRCSPVARPRLPTTLPYAIPSSAQTALPPSPFQFHAASFSATEKITRNASTKVYNGRQVGEAARDGRRCMRIPGANSRTKNPKRMLQAMVKGHTRQTRHIPVRHARHACQRSARPGVGRSALPKPRASGCRQRCRAFPAGR